MQKDNCTLCYRCLKAGTHPVQSLQGFWWLLEPLLLPYREEGKITDVVGHQEMLCVNHPVLRVVQKDNCTLCYRCVNLCPKQSCTVFLHKKPVKQYKGLAG